MSTACAINVIIVFIADGILAEYLAAAGFGEFQPLEAADNEASYANNSCIGFRLNQQIFINSTKNRVHDQTKILQNWKICLLSRTLAQSAGLLVRRYSYRDVCGWICVYF